MLSQCPMSATTRSTALADGRYDAFILSAEHARRRCRALVHDHDRIASRRRRRSRLDDVRDARSVRSRRSAVHARGRRRRDPHRAVSTSERDPGRATRVSPFPGSPERIRTAVSALRGRRPRPLDDGARTRTRHGTGHRRASSGGGIEPPITGPEPVVLPITPPPNGCAHDAGADAGVRRSPRRGQSVASPGTSFVT